MKHRLAAVGLIAGLAGGAVAGVAFGVPGVAGAERTTLRAGTDPSPSTTAPAGPASTPPGPVDRTQWIKDALAPLVANGTITQAQADAIVTALGQAKPARPGGPGPRRGGFGFGRRADLATAAKALGISPAELRQDLQNGQTIADVASAKNVKLDTVIDALVAEAKTDLDRRVADGKMTQAEEDQALAQARDRITQAVNAKLPTPPGQPGDGRGRHGPPKAPSTSPSTTPTATPSAPSPPSTTATTAAS